MLGLRRLWSHSIKLACLTTILRTIAAELDTHTHGTEPFGEGSSIGAVAVTDQVLGRAIPGESLGELSCDPCRGWVRREPSRDQAPPVVAKYHEPIQEPETQGRHHEQVQGGDLQLMVAEKGSPTRRWRPGSLEHVLGHR